MCIVISLCMILSISTQYSSLICGKKIPYSAVPSIVSACQSARIEKLTQICLALSEASTTTTRTRPLNMSSDVTHTATTAALGGMAITTTPASLADAQDAIPGLLDDIVVTHVLRSEYFDDPADLARLPAVSRAMRDAVAATALAFDELDENEAVDLGCLSAVQRLHRGGHLSRQEYLCQRRWVEISKS